MARWRHSFSSSGTSSSETIRRTTRPPDRSRSAWRATYAGCTALTTAVYHRLADVQGNPEPRVVAAVELGIALGGCRPRQPQEQQHLQVRGILLEYIPGLGLGISVPRRRRVVGRASSTRPSETAPSLRDHDILNGDVRLDNFIVSRRGGGDDQRAWIREEASRSA